MSVGRCYLEIVLGLRKLVPGWVESYTGPEDLIAAVDAQARPTADGLRDRVMEFAERVEHEVSEPDRRRWLLGQLNAISTALLWLAGEPFSYTALFERCHGAAVELMSDRQFEQAHALLDSALPGRGGVAPRYRAWRETQLVAPERLQAGLELLAAEMRRRSRERYALPEDEHVIWDLVSGVPWAGNADYLGRRATRVRINVDLPISSPRLLELVCHEAYPGHHTESVCKDASLIRPAGRDEFSVFVYPSPQALMSEGLASHAIEALLGPDAERVAAECLQQAGIAYDHETAVAVREAETLLLSVRSNVALLLDRGTQSPVAREYARAWLLDDTGQIDKAIANLEARTWRPCESCYPVGLTLCRHYAATDQQRFRDLLHMQLTPRDIAI